MELGDLDAASASDVAVAIRRKDVSPTEVMEATLAAVEQRDAAINAVVWLDEEDALSRARAATDVAAQGTEDLPPFFGVPLPIKDLTAVRG